MSEVLGSIWWYLVTIGVLVTFHEFGHFWVARLCGVKVLKFSIGFGPALWSRAGADGTVYSIGAIPLGGYVAMLDERVEEVAAEDRHRAHNNKNNAQKIAIAAAGPGFNFLLAVIAFWLMFSIGKPDYTPVIGRTEGIAAEAGLVAGSRVIDVDGNAYTTWSEVFMAVIEKGLYRRDAVLRVREPDGDERSVTLPLSRLPTDIEDSALAASIGLRLQMPAAVGELLADAPAVAAGVQLGDELRSINGKPIDDFEDFRQTVQSESAVSPRLSLGIVRAGSSLLIDASARSVTGSDGKPMFQLGIGPRLMPTNTTLRHGPLAAVPAALVETWSVTRKTVGFLGDMLVGAISPKHLSGPITIARVANAVAQDGLAWFLGFLAAVSVGIAILNLLPIPILDGGHILSYLIESLKGSPLSERTVVVGQYLGLTLLACLIGVAVFNDLAR